MTVIFDLDGTLTDSKSGIVGCLGKILKAYAIEWEGPLDCFIGPSIEEWAKTLIPNRDKAAQAQLVRDYRACYDRTGWMENAVYPGVFDLLDTLERQGIRLFVCTSKQQQSAELILAKFGLVHYFELVYGDHPQRASHNKQDLLASLVKEQQLDTSTAWMVGDTQFDVEAAHANGVRAIAVTYGYGNVDKLTAVRPYALCGTPAEILKVLFAEYGR